MSDCRLKLPIELHDAKRYSAGMSRFTLSVLTGLMMLATLCTGGCDKYIRDKNAIQDVWISYVDANVHRVGDGVSKRMSQDTIERMNRIRKIALDGKLQEIEALPPQCQQLVLKTKMLGKRSQIQKLSGQQFVEFTVSQGWFEDIAVDWRVRRLVFDPTVTRATGELHNPTLEAELRKESRSRFKFGRRKIRIGSGSEIEMPRFPIGFVKEGGEWKYDYKLLSEGISEWIVEAAKSEQMSLRDFLMNEEGIDPKKRDAQSIWRPMR